MGVTEIHYDDGVGGTVAALLVDGPPGVEAGIVYAHGGSEDGRHFFRDEAVELSRLGATVLVPACGIPLRGDVTADEAVIRRAVSIQRRGLDVLASRGGTRFGFFGHSAGGFQGAILSAEEPRLDAIVIAAYGAGGALRMTNAFERPIPSREAYLEALERFEPEHFLPTPGGRRLLFQHGLLDSTVPREAALHAFELAAEPKTWREYECGHGELGADPEACADRFAFFQQELDLR